MRHLVLTSFAALLPYLALQADPGHAAPQAPTHAREAESTQADRAYSVRTRGKLRSAKPLGSIFTPEDMPPTLRPDSDLALTRALQEQKTLLAMRRNHSSGKASAAHMDKKALQATIEALEHWQDAVLVPLGEYVEFHKIAGEDQKGHVNFTAYYSPVLNVSRERTPQFPYPIYAKPQDWDGPLPTRQQIDGERLLAGKGLELAYASSLAEVYNLQMQGSGYVQYPDGSMELFSYGGTNGYRSQSINAHARAVQDADPSIETVKGVNTFMRENPEREKEVLFHDPSYVFFRRSGAKRTRGAGGVALSEDISIAVDPAYLPLGACLLAAVPTMDARGYFDYHQFRFLLAQDVGGAIKGPGHLDLYVGQGEKGKAKATLNHYGYLWLMKAKA